MNLTLIATVVLMLAPAPAKSDCLKTIDGEVICGKGECQRNIQGVIRCSAFRNGSAVRTLDGRILCGRGHCVTTSKGVVYCSTEPEGSAMIDLYGVPRCEGQCEPALEDYCEAIPAGTLPE